MNESFLDGRKADNIAYPFAILWKQNICYFLSFFAPYNQIINYYSSQVCLSFWLTIYLEWVIPQSSVSDITVCREFNATLPELIQEKKTWCWMYRTKCLAKPWCLHFGATLVFQKVKWVNNSDLFSFLQICLFCIIHVHSQCASLN